MWVGAGLLKQWRGGQRQESTKQGPGTGLGLAGPISSDTH